jgi:hypothetical protein
MACAMIRWIYARVRLFVNYTLCVWLGHPFREQSDLFCGLCGEKLRERTMLETAEYRELMRKNDMWSSGRSAAINEYRALFPKSREPK